MLKIAVVLEKCEEGGYSGSVPTVPGCFSEGETIAETLANLTEAIETHLEATADDLILDDGLILEELRWERLSGAIQGEVESTETGSNPSLEPTRPQPVVFERPGRAIEYS